MDNGIPQGAQGGAGMPSGGNFPQGGFRGGPGGRGMMGAIPGGPTGMIVILAIFAVTLAVLGIAFYKLYQKAGMNGLIGLLAIIPVVNIGVALYLAFAEWPIAAELERTKLRLASMVPGSAAPVAAPAGALEPTPPLGA